MSEPSPHYRSLLADAAGKGFVSVRRRSPRARIIEGALKLGYRRAKLDLKTDVKIVFSGFYGQHKVVRWFRRNLDGTLPDNMILDALRMTAARMLARQHGAAKQRIQKFKRSDKPHSIYVTHNNEHAKLHELIIAMPPTDRIEAYLKAMSANDDYDDITMNVA